MSNFAQVLGNGAYRGPVTEHAAAVDKFRKEMEDSGNVVPFPGAPAQ